MGSSEASQSPRGGRPGSRRENFLDWGISFYEGILARCPNHVDVLQALGHLYTKHGNIEKGLQADLRLSILCPTDRIVHYNLACSYALLGRKDDSLQALERAVLLGFDDVEKMSTDPDLQCLRDEPRFKAILESLPQAPTERFLKDHEKPAD